MDITPTIKLEEHCGALQPADPYSFARTIEAAQPRYGSKERENMRNHKILFNKGRYFETSIYDKKVLNEVSELIDSPVKYDTMIVASWMRLEDFVIAMNCLGIYVSIDIDWI